MDRRAGASWQAVMKHCDLKFGRLRAAWPAELDGFLERMEGGFKLNKSERPVDALAVKKGESLTY